jgi:hypothetical protein
MKFIAKFLVRSVGMLIVMVCFSSFNSSASMLPKAFGDYSDYSSGPNSPIYESNDPEVDEVLREMNNRTGNTSDTGATTTDTSQPGSPIAREGNERDRLIGDNLSRGTTPPSVLPLIPNPE